MREIRDQLHEEGIVISLVMLYKLLHREKETGSVLDKARPPVWRYLSNHCYVFIDNALAEYNELTAKRLKDVMVLKWKAFPLQQLREQESILAGHPPSQNTAS